MAETEKYESNVMRLPNEIIIKILSYLSCTDLLNLSKDKSSKEFIALLTDRDVLKSIDFCQNESTATSQDITSFLKLHSKHVQKICLNNLCSRSPTLRSCFQTLTNLSELHVKNCGFTVSNVVSYLPEIKTLNAFSWSLVDIDNKDFLNIQTVLKDGLEVSPSLTKLNIDAHLNDGERLLLIISLFVNVSYLQIDTFHLKTSSRNLDSIISHSRVLLLPRLDSFIFNIIIFGSFTISHSFANAFALYRSILQKVLDGRPDDLPWKMLQVWEQLLNYVPSLPTALSDSHSSVLICLQMLSDSLHFPESKSAGVFIPAMTVLFPEDCERLQSISEVNAGKQLKHLTLTNCLMNKNFKCTVVECLRTLTASSCNLVEINLLGTHFDENGIQYGVVLKVISQAQAIQRLAIPACIIPHVTVKAVVAKKRKISSTSTEEYNKEIPVKPVLEYLVDNCPNLVELDIRSQKTSPVECSCGSSQGICKDSDLEPISRLLKLEDLTLVDLLGVHRASFLPGSKQQTLLRTLRLSGVGPQGHCLFWPSLQEKFGSMTALQELSLEHHQLPLDKPYFWKPLKKLVSLKRFCIISNFQQALRPTLVTEFLNAVSSVRTLHIHSKATNFKSSARDILSSLKKAVQRRDELIPAVVIQNLYDDKNSYLGNFYETVRLCHKGTTLGLTTKKCGL